MYLMNNDYSCTNPCPMLSLEPACGILLYGRQSDKIADWQYSIDNCWFDLAWKRIL